MDAIWSGVIAIYGPLFFAMICIIIACSSQLKQQRMNSEVQEMYRRNIRMRRPAGFGDYTANLVTMTLCNSDSHLIQEDHSPDGDRDLCSQ